MIFLLDPENSSDYPHILEDLFENRARWLRHIGIAEAEIDLLRQDELDFAYPNHLVYLTASGTLLGSARMLHTTGPNTASLYLEPHFADIPLLRAPTIWEVSRVCLSPDLPDTGGAVSKLRVLAMLSVAGLETARRSGVSSYVSVLDRETERILVENRLHDREIIARGTVECGLDLSVGVTDCEEISIPCLKQRLGIGGNVWLDTVDIFAMEARGASGEDADIGRAFEIGIRGGLECGPRGNLSETQRRRLLDYCSRQIMSARTEKERSDAIRLFEELRRKMFPPPGPTED